MLFLSVAAIFFLMGLIIFLRTKHDYHSEWPFVGLVVAVLAGIALFSCTITIPVNRASVRDHIIQFNAFKETLEEARTHRGLTDLERAAITIKVAEWNSWLASEKYWSTGHTAIWHLNEVNSMEPIK